MLKFICNWPDPLINKTRIWNSMISLLSAPAPVVELYYTNSKTAERKSWCSKGVDFFPGKKKTGAVLKYFRRKDIIPKKFGKQRATGTCIQVRATRLAEIPKYMGPPFFV